MTLDLGIIAKHERAALSFSGGKDSTAVWHLLHEAGVLHRVTVYHLDTGDLLPEVREVVDHYAALTPSFIRIQQDVDGWIDQNGLPSDLVPHTSHDIGHFRDGRRTKLVGRYECCFRNLMWPVYQRFLTDGITLVLRGTKTCDMRALPVASGDVVEGVEFYYPIQDWSHDQVFAYLRERNAKLSSVYDHVVNAPECATCSAWWSEGRASYLKQLHPELFQKYATRLRAVVAEIEPVIGTLLPEMSGIADRED